MQSVFFEVLDQGTPRAVNDAFGCTRGARGVEDVERMIEGKLPKRDRILGRLSERFIPGHGSAGNPRIRPARVRDDDDPLQ